MPGILGWRELPDRFSGRADEWAEAAEQMRARPMVWALVLEAPTETNLITVKNYIRNGTGPFRPQGSFEAAQRTTKTDVETVVGLYARYVAVDESEVEEL